MPKKLPIILFTIMYFIFCPNLAVSQDKRIVPIKKPILTNIELQKKISVNILKPLPKPDIVKKAKIIEKVVNKKTPKPKYLIPKK